MMNEYCGNRACPFKDCKMHYDSAPNGVAFKVRDVKCARYDEFCKDLVNMTISRAENIVFNIRTGEEPREMKMLAVHKVMLAKGAKMVGREALYNVIRYLMSLVWDSRNMEAYLTHAKTLNE